MYVTYGDGVPPVSTKSKRILYRLHDADIHAGGTACPFAAPHLCRQQHALEPQP
jgi:hypothetical protein